MKKEKREKLEMKVYELLGVKGFRKLTFKLEKLIHKKDKKVNHNYHVNPLDISKKPTIDELEEFKKKLYYNGSIHVRNLMFLAISMIILIVLKLSIWLIVLNLLFGIKDAYCVMLQRYNYLRIEKTIRIIKKNMERKAKKVVDKEIGQETKKSLEEIQKKQENYQNIDIDKISNILQGKQNGTFSTSDIEKLKKLRDFILNNIDIINPQYQKQETSGYSRKREINQEGINKDGE